MHDLSCRMGPAAPWPIDNRERAVRWFFGQAALRIAN